MIRARRQAEFSTWQAPGSELTVVYSEAAMRLVVARALEALHAMPGRGVETGGVLFGTADDGEVRITVSRPIPCSHSYGPGWILNEEEESELAAAVEEYADDPELSGLVPVGLYVSRTRGGVTMTEHDVALFERYFPDSRQAALVLRPEPGKATRAGFFVRDSDGRLDPQASPEEFVAAPASEMGFKPAARLANAEAGVKPQLTVVSDAPPELLRPPEELLERPREPGIHWKLIFTVSVAASALAAGLLLWHRPEPAEAPRAHSPGLRLEERNGALFALWDAQSPALTSAASATLEINDGEARRVLLNRGLLESGEWPLSARSGEVAVKLRLGQNGPVLDTARYAGGTPARASGFSSGDEARLRAGRSELEARRRQLQERILENEELERRVESLREILSQRLSAPPPAAPARPRPAPAPVAVQPKPQPQTELIPTPPPASDASAVSSAPLSPVSITAEPVRPPSPPERPAPQFAERNAPRPAAPPSAGPPKASAYSGPTRGRILWTGALPAGGSLSFDGRRVSSGSMVGGLPGVPVRIGALPMELGPQGFTVWSGNARHASGASAEEPGPQNGWQRTTFRYDPRRAGEIVVVEPPSAAGNWSRMLLRGGRSAVNAILIEWEVIPQ
jgi:hypothetical protein